MTTSPWAEENAAGLFAFEMLSQRELEETTRLWQTPTLALTAQAFLLTIALGPDTGRLPRILASLLGVVIAVMAVQLMAKHHHLADRDFMLLQHLEGQLQLPRTIAREALPGMQFEKPGWFVSLSSYKLWRRGLLLMGLTNVVALILAVAWPDVLAGSALSGLLRG